MKTFVSASPFTRCTLCALCCGAAWMIEGCTIATNDPGADAAVSAAGGSSATGGVGGAGMEGAR